MTAERLLAALPVLTVQQLNSLLHAKVTPDQPQIFVLDVREDAEWAQSHIAHPAVHHIPMAKLEAALSTQPPTIPHAASIAVLCKSGGRSARVGAFLMALGFNVSNVLGGMQAWVNDVDPSLPQP